MFYFETKFKEEVLEVFKILKSLQKVPDPKLSFLNILKKVIDKKILYLCIENMLKSSFYSVAFNFFGPCLLFSAVVSKYTDKICKNISL